MATATTYDVPECLRQERFAPDEWPDLGLCESYVGWSQHKRTDPGCNKFPKSTSLRHLKPRCQVATLNCGRMR